MFENIKAVMFDLDGTIYYGSKIIDGVEETLDCFNKKGTKIFFLTNNSTRTRLQVYEKLIDMGLKCELEQVFTSGYIAALYAKKENLKNMYIFGSENLKSEFEDIGIKVIEDEAEAENLLIGYNTQFDYEKLTQALNIALKGNTIIACNKERHFPGENARRLPGCGAMVGAIETCINREVDFVIGKPNTLMLDILSELNFLTKDEVLMVGDTYESDIAMANSYGCKSILISKEKYNDTTTVDHINQIIDLINN
jgi:HAD superfamily hydrolase (TIGR01450 family)